jgi:hypothetical protein
LKKRWHKCLKTKFWFFEKKLWRRFFKKNHFKTPCAVNRVPHSRIVKSKYPLKRPKGAKAIARGNALWKFKVRLLALKGRKHKRHLFAYALSGLILMRFYFTGRCPVLLLKPFQGKQTSFFLNYTAMPCAVCRFLELPQLSHEAKTE